MKKLLIISTLVLGVLFVSCKKEEPTVSGGKYADYPYSKLDPEAQKAKLAEESDAILEKLRDLPNSEAIELLKSLAKRMSYNDEESPKNDNYHPDYGSMQFRTEFWKNDAVQIKDVQGKFEWNANIEDWDYQKTTDNKLSIHLPATVDGTANNGRIEIVAIGSGVMNELEKYEMPENVSINMYADTRGIGSIRANASGIKSDGAESASAEMKLGDYTISTTADRDGDSKVNSTFKFVKGNDLILEGILGTTVDWEYVFGYNDDYSSESSATTMLDYQSVELNIGSNLAIVGHAHVIKIIEELDAISDKYNSLSRNIDAAKESAAAYNNNAKLYLVSTKDEWKIADVKMSHYEYKWNGENYYGNELILVFNDRTEVSAESFFSEGFEEAIEAWGSFIGIGK